MRSWCWHLCSTRKSHPGFTLTPAGSVIHRNQVQATFLASIHSTELSLSYMQYSCGSVVWPVDIWIPISSIKLSVFVFYTRLFAIGSQLSPEVGSSGIEMLETDVFKLHCFQTLTGQWCEWVSECYCRWNKDQSNHFVVSHGPLLEKKADWYSVKSMHSVRSLENDPSTCLIYLFYVWQQLF